LPDEFDQARFDEAVDVFGRGVFRAVEKAGIGGHLADLLQAAGDRFDFGLLQNSGQPKRASMNRACPQVGEDQSAVETEAGVERREIFIGLAGEPAPPEIHKIAECGMRNAE
jgi:hypothetical protein